MPQGFSDGVSAMEVSFTTLPRETSLSLSPTPTRNFNRILSTAIISSASLSLKPMPAFAKISHPELVNFEVQEIQALCYSTHPNRKADRPRPQRGHAMKDLEYLDNITDHLKWWLASACWKSPPPSMSFLDSSSEIPACGKLPDQRELAKKLYVDSKPQVVYEDIIVGTGQPINDQKLLQVNLHYDFYDSSHNRLHGNYWSNKNSKRKPEEILLCNHKFGEGFENGIQGMREGGVRRIFVPKEFSPGEYPGTFDVELLQVCPSVQCHVINKVGINYF